MNITESDFVDAPAARALAEVLTDSKTLENFHLLEFPMIGASEAVRPLVLAMNHSNVELLFLGDSAVKYTTGLIFPIDKIRFICKLKQLTHSCNDNNIII